jgi:hypothetical protein
MICFWHSKGEWIEELWYIQNMQPHVRLGFIASFSRVPDEPLVSCRSRSNILPPLMHHSGKLGARSQVVLDSKSIITSCLLRKADHFTHIAASSHRPKRMIPILPIGPAYAEWAERKLIDRCARPARKFSFRRDKIPTSFLHRCCPVSLSSAILLLLDYQLPPPTILNVTASPQTGESLQSVQ